MIYTVSIGSNEQREANLALARRRLKELFPDIRFAGEEETAPLRCRRTAPFANQLARFRSDSPAHEVDALLKAIEREAGRKPEEKEREIIRLDIDLLACDATIFKPEDMQREYVRKGLSQLDSRAGTGGDTSPGRHLQTYTL